MPSDLFQPFLLGDLKLSSRVVMAPMTRNRARQDGTVPPMMAVHYRQRTSAGLIITESTTVSPEAVGYPFTPGLYTAAQADSWRTLIDGVHQEGGRIFVQLQHCGRISHPSLQPDGAPPVAPSALRPDGNAVTYQGYQPFVTPRSLATDEISRVVAQFRTAAAYARRAGFDGVEVHGANGYLIDQFLRDGTNQRTDAYGGSVDGRLRLLDEILDAVCAELPAERVGVRLSPENAFNSMSDSDPGKHFEVVAARLGNRGLAYLHVLEGDMMSKRSSVDYLSLRNAFGGTYIANNGYDRVRARAAIAEGAADLVAFGTSFIANPDLVHRLREGLPLAKPDATKFYGGDETGYTDYPDHDMSS